MKLSMKQMMYGSVLAAAGVAWGIDTAFFGPPPAAHAGQLASDGASIAGGKSTIGEALADGPEHLLSTRLQKWAAEHAMPLAEMPDVFQPQTVPKQVIAVALPQTQPVEDPAMVFNRRHRLMAIVLYGGGGYALIDGRVLRVGQTIDDTQLIGLTRRRARFSSGDRMFDVPLNADVTPDH